MPAERHALSVRVEQPPVGCSRRDLLAGMCGLAASVAAPSALAGTHASFPTLWQDFRRRFVTSDGRVIDTGNSGVSHSESQGYGLIFAARANDQEAFRRILAFTRQALRVRPDRLHAWRYDPRQATPVADRNNATDGDLAIAWGLLEGAVRWNDAELAADTQAILRDLFRVTGREVGGRYFLLPGAFGFEGRDHVIQNPSYAMFPAWAALRHVMPTLPWRRLEQDALSVLSEGLFGARALPPDWLQVASSGRQFLLPERWPKRFSYDAIRVPLFLAWAGHRDHPALRSVVEHWRRSAPQATPAWVELPTDRVANYRASPGMLAVRALAMRDGGLLAQTTSMTGDDYYSASLRLLARMAATPAGVA